MDKADEGKVAKDKLEEENKDCFVIMPIADTDGYDKGHFKRIYNDIFIPAIQSAGFNANRADENKGANLIQLEILRKIVECPMAICDLSNRNPNVLFELGIRQAFDMPVVLVKEVGTPKIFDIDPIRYYEYRPEGKYREVLEDQNGISDMIVQTLEESRTGKSINSIVRLLSLTKPASLPDIKTTENDLSLRILMGEMGQMRDEIRKLANINRENRDFEKIYDMVSESKNLIKPDCFVTENDNSNVRERISEIVYHGRENLRRYKRYSNEIMSQSPSALVNFREELRLQHNKYCRYAHKYENVEPIKELSMEFGLLLNKVNAIYQTQTG